MLTIQTSKANLMADFRKNLYRRAPAAVKSGAEFMVDRLRANAGQHFTAPTGKLQRSFRTLPLRETSATKWTHAVDWGVAYGSVLEHGPRNKRGWVVRRSALRKRHWRNWFPGALRPHVKPVAEEYAAWVADPVAKELLK